MSIPFFGYDLLLECDKILVVFLIFELGVYVLWRDNYGRHSSSLKIEKTIICKKKNELNVGVKG